MRNIQGVNTRDSYRILAASDAQVDPAEARRYRQGHVFLTGEEKGERETIGYSSGGKVWSVSNLQIPDLIHWCRGLGVKIRSTGPVRTNSSLDLLDAGRVVDRIPEHLIYVEWNKDSFDFSPPVQIHYAKDDGTPYSGHILDLELEIDRANTDVQSITVNVIGEGVEFPINFTLNDYYRANAQDATRITVNHGNWSTGLVEYLNASNLSFYSADGSLFVGNELFEPKEEAIPINLDQVITWDWNGCDIENETIPNRGLQSIHERVRQTLIAGFAPVIIYDHGKGEIADFVTLEEDGDSTVFHLYHCKGSGGPVAGARIDDVYEVAGQAQKSVVWATLSKIQARLTARRTKRVFLRGSEQEIADLLDRAKARRREFVISIVQPGISKVQLNPVMAECLGATSAHLIGSGIKQLEVIASQ
jgi:hypothetical protein